MCFEIFFKNETRGKKNKSSLQFWCHRLPGSSGALSDLENKRTPKNATVADTDTVYYYSQRNM